MKPTQGQPSSAGVVSNSYAVNLMRRKKDNLAKRNLNVKGLPIPGERSAACCARIRRRLVRRLARGKNFPYPINLTPSEKLVLARSA
jgi:hypothetical protein